MFDYSGNGAPVVVDKVAGVIGMWNMIEEKGLQMVKVFLFDGGDSARWDLSGKRGTAWCGMGLDEVAVRVCLAPRAVERRGQNQVKSPLKAVG